jgi:hypothetical protein
VTLQERHDLADNSLVGPARDDSFGAFGSDAFDLKQSLRIALNYVEDCLAENFHQPLSEDRSDAFDESRAEIFFHPFG